MSIVLLLGALYGVLRAAMLCFIPVNRVANRFMAALIVTFALYTFPYIIGFAGYYDAYPWLSFFPYNLSLAPGPLLYLYLACVLEGRTTPSWRWHLTPALLQFIYYCLVFAQPLAFKNRWDTEIHVPLVWPVESLAVLVSLLAYWWLSWRRWRSAAQDLPRDWPRNLLIAFGLTVAAWVILTTADLALSLTYFQRFPFYLWLAIVTCYLATEGSRQGGQPLPLPEPRIAEAGAHAPREPEQAAQPAPSLSELGARWRATVLEEQWWRDPELNLATLARRLGTNTTILSRSMNEGLGLNFNEMINRMRVDAVIAALQVADDDQPILDIALSEGFNSKASFNRAFKLYTGETPSEFRRRKGRSAQVSSSDAVSNTVFRQ